MTSAELRIGNLVRDSKTRDIIVVHSISMTGINHDYSNGDDTHELEFLEPIRLTEEWLTAFGFEKEIDDQGDDGDGNREDAVFFKLGNLELMEYGEEKKYLVVESLNEVYCDSVHELQNIFYFLSKSDLDKVRPESQHLIHNN